MNRWLQLLLLTGVGAGVYFAVQFVRRNPPALFSLPSTSPLPPSVTFRLEQLSVVGRKNNRPAWTLQADRLDTTREHRLVTFEGNVEAEFFQENGPSARVNASSATYASDQKRIVAPGPVRLVVPGKTGKNDDLQITSAKIVWDVGSRVVQSPGNVSADLGVSRVTGEDLQVDLKTRDVTLRNFSATMPVNDDGTLPPLPDVLERITP